MCVHVCLQVSFMMEVILGKEKLGAAAAAAAAAAAVAAAAAALVHGR